jgi:hypothetical protein
MSDTIRIKRRANGGAAGAPSSLKTTEIAYNETDDILYLGYGDDGSGNATSIRSLAGFGAVVGLTGNQTIAGSKTFSSQVTVPDDAYDATTWNGNTNVPTKNAVRDKIEALAATGVSDGDKGDVVVSSGGTVYTIDTDVVDNTKLANMTTKTYKGRTSAGTGDPEDVSVATLKTDLSLNNVDNTSDVNKPVSTAQQTALDLKANLVSPTLTGTPLTPTAASGTNTTQIASTAYVISEIAARLASNDAMLYKGAIDASANPNYPAANAGDTYRISVAGKIGGASGPNVEVGDIIISHVDSSASGTQAGIGANWDIIQTNIDGALTTASIGVTVQAYNANLAAIAGLTSAADKLAYFTGSNTAAVTSFTSVARTLLSQTTQAAMRTTGLGLGTMSTQDASAVAITGGTIDGVTIDGGTF